MKFKLLMIGATLALAVQAPAQAERYLAAHYVQQMRASRAPGAAESLRIVEQSRSVLDRMAAAYRIPTPDYYIDTQPELNAYVKHENGRRIMVMSTKMLALIGDDPDLQAAVIGHELGHLHANHLEKSQSTALFVSILGAVLGSAVDARQARRGVYTDAGRTVGHVGAGLVIAKFSRDDEREADSLGVTAMARAGYDPMAAARLWKKLMAYGHGGSGLWMSSHPSNAEREQTVAALAASVRRAEPPAVAGAQVPTEPPLTADPLPASDVVSLTPTQQDIDSRSPYLVGSKALAEKRFRAAISSFKEAAAAGDARAMLALGVLYGEAPQGSGVLVDHQQAKGWLDRAVAKGLAPAMAIRAARKLTLGDDYSGGFDAERLLRWATARGDAMAPATLAFAYLEGAANISRDEALATRYAKIATERGSVEGKAIYATLQTARAKSPEEAQASLEMLQATASQLPQAHYLIGSLHEHGLGIPKDRDMALAAYRLAAGAGVEAAKKRLVELGQ